MLLPGIQKQVGFFEFGGADSRSFEVKRGQTVKTCKHDNSMRQSKMKLIFVVWVLVSEYKKPIDFGGGRRSFDVRMGQTVETL